MLQGNWAEERGAADADPAAAPQPRFAGQSASHAAHGPQVLSALRTGEPRGEPAAAVRIPASQVRRAPAQGKFGAGIACHRHDGARREPAGPSAVMAHADARQPCYTTLYQLSFGAPPVAWTGAGTAARPHTPHAART